MDSKAGAVGHGSDDVSIEVVGLSVAYGRRQAVDDVTLSFGRGVTGILGPNGAGKSSLMRTIVGLQHPATGRVRVAGVDAREHPRRTRARIGYVPERSGMPPEMTVLQFLRHASEAKAIARGERATEVQRVMTSLAIADIGDRFVGNLSKGYRQRLALAQALIGDPPVLILDEPTSGVDPTTVAELYELIDAYGQAKTVLVSSHVMADVRAVCERVVVMGGGHVVWDGDLSEVGVAPGPVRSRVVLAQGSNADRPAAADWGAECEVTRTQELGPRMTEFVVQADGGQALSATLSGLVAAGAELVSVQPLSDGLTELFRAAVRRQSGTAAAQPEDTTTGAAA